MYFMRKYPKITKALLVIFVAGMAVQFLCIFTGLVSDIQTLLGFSWLIMAVAFCSFLACMAKAKNNADMQYSDLESRVKSLTNTLLGAETALTEKSGVIKEYEQEMAHITDINNSYKKQMALLRNEVASSKTRLAECRQLMDELRVRAELGDSVKAAFVANIHDEMRNPLNSILGYLSLLSGSSVSDDKRCEYVDRISKDATHFLDTVNDLFYYAKLLAGDVDMVATTFNISSLVNSSVSMARQWVSDQGKQIDIVLDMDPDLGFICGFESGYLKIIYNLLSNAVKFTHQGRITVTCRRDHSSVVLAVEDTGIGFDADKRDMIFSGFYQVEYYLTRKYGGTGLGLSICRALARVMNGDITAESRKGVGSRFCLEVPIIEASDVELDLFARVDRLLNARSSLGRVMMITPFGEDFDFVNRFFAHYGVAVMRSNSPDETEALLAEFSDISLVVIDLFSQALEGVSAAESIFRIRPNARFVFVGNGAGLNPAQMDMVGMYSDYVLPKPLTSVSLGRVVSNFS